MKNADHPINARVVFPKQIASDGLCAKVEQYAKCNMHLLTGTEFHYASTVFI